MPNIYDKTEGKMPDHITDGPQTPEDVKYETEPDPDEAYDEMLQRRLDDSLCIRCGERAVPDPGDRCPECIAETWEFIFDRLNGH